MCAVEKKVIPVGDYIKDVDNIVPIPVMHQGEKYEVELRIRKPMAEHSHKMMQALSVTFGDKLATLEKRTGENIDFVKGSHEDRKELILFQWLHTCTLISSCCYHPDLDENGKPVEVPRLVWSTAEDVGANCPDDLFKQLSEYLSGIGIEQTISEVEAKK